MQVAVLIVSFNSSDDVLRCLAALARSTYPEFEVTICENGDDAAFAKLETLVPKRLPNGQAVRVLHAPYNGGYASGINLCLLATKSADAWWILNPDTEPHSDALEGLVARLSEGDCDAVGNTLCRPDGSVQSHGGIWRSWLARAVSIGSRDAAPYRVEGDEIELKQNYLNGASLVVSKAFLERTGLMREDYFLYCEEVEWCLRGVRRGARLGFAPRSSVVHHQGTTTGNTADPKRRSALPIYLDERNKLLLTRDLYPTRLPVAVAATLLLILFRYGRRGAWSQLLAALRGWVAGIRNQRGSPRSLRHESTVR